MFLLKAAKTCVKGKLYTSLIPRLFCVNMFYQFQYQLGHLVRQMQSHTIYSKQPGQTKPRAHRLSNPLVKCGKLV